MHREYNNLFQSGMVPLKSRDGMHLRLRTCLFCGNAALRQVLQRLQEAGFRVNKAKCSFSVSEITYLGFKISSRGVETTTEKLDAILKVSDPRNVKELRMWLGLINYYGRFLQNLATYLSPLYRLLRADQPWRWTEVESLAFRKAKELLVKPPSWRILIRPCRSLWPVTPGRERWAVCSASAPERESGQWRSIRGH